MYWVVITAGYGGGGRGCVCDGCAGVGDGGSGYTIGGDGSGGVQGGTKGLIWCW